MAMENIKHEVEEETAGMPESEDIDERMALHKQLVCALAASTMGEEMNALINVFKIDSNQLRQICHEIAKDIMEAIECTADSEIQVHGSMLMNTMLHGSSIDFFLQYKGMKHYDIEPSDGRKILNQFLMMMEFSKDFGPAKMLVNNSKVPYLQFEHLESQIIIKMNASSFSSQPNDLFMRTLMNFDMRLRQLIMFLKIWAKQSLLLGDGKLTSYAIFWLAIFYLQNEKDPATQSPLVVSVQQMQLNELPRYVQCGNFAFNITDYMCDWSPAVTTLMLIKGFFMFYQKFLFEENVISPYLGTCVDRQRMAAGMYCFASYAEQRKHFRNEYAVEPMQLALTTPLCVQDPFFLFQNIAVDAQNLPSLRKYIQNACDVFSVSDNLSLIHFYELLIFGEVFRGGASPGAQLMSLSELLAPQANASVASDRLVTTQFSHSMISKKFLPSRKILKTIMAHNGVTNEDQAYDRWTELFTAALQKVLVVVFALDVKLVTPSGQWPQRLVNCSNVTTYWSLSGTVDLWTRRQFEKSKYAKFMEYQAAQTKQMLQERRRSLDFSTSLEALLIVSQHNELIELHILKWDKLNLKPSAEIITRNDKVRKFFGMLVCSMENCDLKDWLDGSEASLNDERAPLPPNIDLK